MDFNSRLEAIQRLYAFLERLETHLGGRRTLADSDGRSGWPASGVYFFFEPGETRSTSGQGARLVRVGTHALKSGSRSTLWKRLSQHRGALRSGSGNHRGSIFRLHVGTALIQRDAWPAAIAAAWSSGQSAPRSVRAAELPLEQAVSQYIRSMPFLWLEIDDEPGPDSLRGFIERNSIALLSNCHNPENPIDPPSEAWLGRWAASDAVRRSGLWNVNHVSETPDLAFLDILEAIL